MSALTTRLKTVTDEDLQRITKYHEAYRILEGE